jgi:mannosyltransferase
MSAGAPALAALTLAAAVLRLATIDVQSFWFDEALTVRLLRLPLGDMLGELPDRELTPPLYYLLAWPWAKLFGTGEVAIRSFSALAGTLTVPVAYAIGRELASMRVALMLAALTAFNPLLIWYSQETRPYALLVLLGALSLLFFLRALRRSSAAALALWAAASALALLTHYFAAFLVVPEGVWLVVAARLRLREVLAGGFVAAVGASLIPLAVHQRDRVSTEYISSLSLPRRALGVPEDFLTGFVIGLNKPVEHVLAVVAGVAAVAGLGLAVARTDAEERRAVLLAGAMAVLAVGVPLVLATVGPDYLNTRNVILGWAPVALVLAIGFGARRTDARLGVAGVAVLCAVGLATTVATTVDRDLHRSDWRSAGRALGAPDGPRALAVPPVSGDVSLGIYQDGLRPLPPARVRVRELDVVTVRNLGLEARGALRPAAPGPPPSPAFRLTEARYEETFVLVRYRAGAPQLVSPAALARTAKPVVPAPSLLLQAPGAAPGPAATAARGRR